MIQRTLAERARWAAAPVRKEVVVLKRTIAIVAGVLAVAALAVPTATGQQASPLHCLDGQTVTLPVSVSAAQGSGVLDAGQAGSIIASTGGPFFFGELTGPSTLLVFLLTSNIVTAEAFLEPGFTQHTVTAGACPAGPFVPPPPPVLPACYSTHQVDPGYWPNAIAKALYTLGYWRPYAVTEPVSNTNLGNGYWLTCRLDGRTVKNGAAISSGMGGRPVDSTGTIPGAAQWPAAAVMDLLTNPDRMGEFVEIAVRS